MYSLALGVGSVRGKKKNGLVFVLAIGNAGNHFVSLFTPLIWSSCHSSHSPVLLPAQHAVILCSVLLIPYHFLLSHSVVILIRSHLGTRSTGIWFVVYHSLPDISHSRPQE
jgi:hypothetical protein